MMEILQQGNKKLKRKSKRVSKIDSSIKQLCEDLVETMISNEGAGIAAPQCGILKRIIVVLVNDTPKVMINPEILFHSNETECNDEGCLSIPGTFIQKERYSSVTIKYRNVEGHPHLETHTGLPAIIIQHEIDHLNGVLMTDDVPPDELAQHPPTGAPDDL
jgi:peptide deformylase